MSETMNKSTADATPSVSSSGGAGDDTAPKAVDPIQNTLDETGSSSGPSGDQALAQANTTTMPGDTKDTLVDSGKPNVKAESENLDSADNSRPGSASTSTYVEQSHEGHVNEINGPFSAAMRGIIQHARGPNDYVVPSPGMEACNESTSLFHQPAPTALVNPLLQRMPGSQDVQAGVSNDVTRRSYEDKLAELDDAEVPPLAGPMVPAKAAQTGGVPDGRTTEHPVAVNQERYPMTHAVVIAKDYTSAKTLTLRNGHHFQEVPVGIEAQVSEAILATLDDSDVPHTSRPL